MLEFPGERFTGRTVLQAWFHVCTGLCPRPEAMLFDRYGPDRIDPPTHDDNAKTRIVHILGCNATTKTIVTQPRTNWRSITKPVASWQRQSQNVKLSLMQLSYRFYPSSGFRKLHDLLLCSVSGRPSIRKSSQLMLEIPCRRAVSSLSGAQITSGLNAG